MFAQIALGRALSVSGMKGAEVIQDVSFFFLTCTEHSVRNFMHPVPQQQICCMLRGLGLPMLKRAHTEELQTPRPPKKPTSEPAAVIQAPKKPEVLYTSGSNGTICSMSGWPA